MEFQKVPHQDRVDKFSEFQVLVHKKFVTEGKRASAEIFKRDFPCCTIMGFPTKLQVFESF
jgi:hypothetical protein